MYVVGACVVALASAFAQHGLSPESLGFATIDLAIQNRIGVAPTLAQVAENDERGSSLIVTAVPFAQVRSGMWKRNIATGRSGLRSSA